MTATSSMENAVGAGKLSTREDRLHRGRKVTTAFLMQGWGQFVNQVLLIVLLLIFNHGNGDPPYGLAAVQWTFRLSFAIPAIAKRKSNVTGYDIRSLATAYHFFGGRMFATSGSWFFNDVLFYGNKLFQVSSVSTFSFFI